MKLPFLGRQDTVTLVIDSAAARILVARDGSVAQWASLPIDEGLIVEGAIQDTEATGKIVAALFQQNGVSRRNVVTCVSGAQAVNRILTLPAMRKEDIGNAISYQAKRDLPVPLEQLVVAWQVLDSNEQQTRVFVIGIPIDLAQRLAVTLRQARVSAKAIDVKPLALARALGRPTAIVGNVEVDSIDIVCLSDYAPLIMHSIYFPQPETSAAELGRRLADEVQRSIRYYNESNRQEPIKANTPVILTGGGADYFSLVEALYGTMEYTIEKFSPPITFPSEFPLEEYAANIGLALKGK